MVPQALEKAFMSVREIPVAQWDPFLDEFSREHRAWLASVERAHPGAPAHLEVGERALRSIETDAVTGIEIRFQDGTVRVEAPKTLRVDETDEGAARGLEIEDWSGERVRLRFRVAEPPGALDGLAPLERS
jgi:hypothetical protein